MGGCPQFENSHAVDMPNRTDESLDIVVVTPVDVVIKQDGCAWLRMGACQQQACDPEAIVNQHQIGAGVRDTLGPGAIGYCQ